jgi:hypothetical protein
MSRTDLAWLAVAAYALHIMEEQILDWLGAARRAIHLSMDYANYRLITTVFLILGAVSAMLAASQPIFALSFAAFLLINAVYFHIWPMIRTGTPVPGIVTAVLLFLPIGIAQYNVSATQPRDYVISIVLGALSILFPLALIKYSGAFAGGRDKNAAPPRRRRR